MSKEAEADLPNVEVLAIDVDGKNADISAPLEIRMAFALDIPLRDARWEISFMADCVDARILQTLGETKEQDYEAGESSFCFRTDRVDVSGVKPGVLSNAGLLMCRLLAGDRQEVATVNMVVQVKRQGDTFVREIISPLD